MHLVASVGLYMFSTSVCVVLAKLLNQCMTYTTPRNLCVCNQGAHPDNLVDVVDWLLISIVFRNKRDILTRIERLPFLDQTTNTPAAIRYMRDEMFTRRRGDRSDAPNVAIIITDGVPR